MMAEKYNTVLKTKRNIAVKKFLALKTTIKPPIIILSPIRSSLTSKKNTIHNDIAIDINTIMIGINVRCPAIKIIANPDTAPAIESTLITFLVMITPFEIIN